MTETGSSGAAGPGRAGTREWAGLAVLMLPVLLISVDMTVLGFAVPYLSVDLAPSGPQLLWIVDIYSFLLAGLLVTMGTLGDRIGRRRLLLLGATGFGAASVLCAYAPSAELLIAGRALLGVAGATLMPSTLSLLRGMFPDERQRLFAIATWGSAFTAGEALGPTVGGWLLQHFWWGSVFLLNLPVIALTLIAAPLLVRESRDPAPGRFDPRSVVLSLATVLPVVYGIKTVAKGENAVVPALLIVAGLAAGYRFVRRQQALPDPMLDVSLFSVRRFTAAIGADLLVVFAMSGVLLLLPQHLQLVQDIEPATAGLLLLPGAALAIAAGFVAAALARHLSTGTLVGGGLGVTAAGLVCLSLLSPSRQVLVTLLAFALIGVGAATAMTLTNSVIMATVPPRRAGAASAISETAIELGGALGVAVLGSLAATFYRAGLPAVDGVDPAAMDAAGETFGAAMNTAARIQGPVGESLAVAAREAFTRGLNLASLTGAVLLLAVAVWSAIALRTRSDKPD